jgi:tRNA/rRNA methyltransferase
VSGRLENLRVVLVGTRNPLNLGAVARAMSNFGAMHLRVVQPYEKAFREAVSAVGASEVMKNAEECATVAEAVADCVLVVGTTAVGNRDIRQPLRNLEEAEPLIQKQMEKGRVALLFGSEKWGLSNESLSYCHWLLRIPTREEHRSMNLGQAAAVCLYELGSGEPSEKGGKEFTAEGAEGPQRAQRRGLEGAKGAGDEKDREEHPKTYPQTTRGGHPAKNNERATGEPAKMETVERIGAALLEALRKSGYVGRRNPELAEEKLRRMFRRFQMEEEDAEALLGMVRKILWKMEEGRKGTEL